MKGVQYTGVFFVSLAILVATALWGLIYPQSMDMVGNLLFEQMTENFGWLYLMSMFIFVAFAMFLAFSKYGKVRLGKDTDKPEHGSFSWHSMLFIAGMGIGLVFWGVAEPLNHFLFPDGMEGGTDEAAGFAIAASFFHWGFHPWANYTVLALPLAYMQFRKGKPGLISSIFIPLLGEERVKGPVGKAIDIMAIFTTVVGVATSLGFGVLQISSGMNFLFDVPATAFVQVIIIVTMTGLFMASAISGIDKGIKFLSNFNIALAFTLMIAIAIVGPTVVILNTLVNGIGQYLAMFVPESFRINPFGDNAWINGWRVFYWAWWVTWAPFVGMFLARISKGRTIKEFVIGVMFVPTAGSFLWFSVLGGTGISLGPDVAARAIVATETAFFVVMEYLPLGSAFSIVTVLLVCIFFITSADSATFVLGMFSSGGSLNPSAAMKLIWGTIQGLMATALLLAGGLALLQTIAIITGLPFAVVMLLGCASLFKSLRKEALWS